ncbi:HNH endonuclease signature motif containing protein [Catenibacterium sp. RTP21428st1_B8_RTP21428_210409]|uniref:HNH endonuclease signature motif containing protein n=1 Tax=Catenibacterium sp. RTP21428st1_B8_RTP21428_210409 TaxID=3153689 RepID=UPI0032EEC0B2
MHIFRRRLCARLAVHGRLHQITSLWGQVIGQVLPWSKGGKTVIENCQMLCRDCNLKKGAQ